MYWSPSRRNRTVRTQHKPFFLRLAHCIAPARTCKGYSKIFRFIIGAKNFEATPLTGAVGSDVGRLCRGRKGIWRGGIWLSVWYGIISLLLLQGFLFGRTVTHYGYQSRSAESLRDRSSSAIGTHQRKDAAFHTRVCWGTDGSEFCLANPKYVYKRIEDDQGN